VRGRRRVGVRGLGRRGNRGLKWRAEREMLEGCLRCYGSGERKDGIKRGANRIMYIVSTWDEREGLRNGFRPIVKMQNSYLGSRNGILDGKHY
jgi:hypothetical protein